MARTASQGRSRKASSSSSSRRSNSGKGRAKSAARSSRSNETWLEGISSSPAFSYIAGGMGFAALAGVAYRFADTYPRITTFFRDNIELIEGKLSEFRGIESGKDLSDEARH